MLGACRASGLTYFSYLSLIKECDVVKLLRMPYFEVGVYPSMNPSRVQLRRYAILGCAYHTHPEVLVDHIYDLHLSSSSHLYDSVFLIFLINSIIAHY